MRSQPHLTAAQVESLRPIMEQLRATDRSIFMIGQVTPKLTARQWAALFHAFDEHVR